MRGLFNKVQKKYLFLAIGLLYSIAVPLGWSLLAPWLQLTDYGFGLYIYLFVCTALVLGGLSYLVGYSQDMLYQILEKDPLTGLLNQQAFFRRARDYYQLGVRYHDQIAMIMLDIDHFKTVNDRHSHLVGSYVLKQLASVIENELRRTDIAARFGGDEFIIFLPRTDMERALSVAERLRELIAHTAFNYKEMPVRITASFGVVMVPCDPEISVEDLAETADQLLYQAKDEGRNRVCSRPFAQKFKGSA